jgi:hypothetical protein
VLPSNLRPPGPSPTRNDGYAVEVSYAVTTACCCALCGLTTQWCPARSQRPWTRAGLHQRRLDYPSHQVTAQQPHQPRRHCRGHGPNCKCAIAYDITIERAALNDLGAEGAPFARRFASARQPSASPASPQSGLRHTTKISSRSDRICSIATARSEALAGASSWTTNALIVGPPTQDPVRSTNRDVFAHISHL